MSVRAALPNGCATVPVVFALVRSLQKFMQKFRGPHSELCSSSSNLNALDCARYIPRGVTARVTRVAGPRPGGGDRAESSHEREHVGPPHTRHVNNLLKHVAQHVVVAPQHRRASARRCTKCTKAKGVHTVPVDHIPAHGPRCGSCVRPCPLLGWKEQRRGISRADLKGASPRRSSGAGWCGVRRSRPPSPSSAPRRAQAAHP